MGYKLKSGTEIIDDEGNLVITQGARLYAAGTVYANNTLGINNQDVANVFSGAFPQFSVLKSTTPFHIGYDYGYYVGGDKSTTSPAYNVDSTPVTTFNPRDIYEPDAQIIGVDLSNISRWPFAISSAPAVVDHSELSYTGPSSPNAGYSNNQVLGAGLSDGTYGYYAGGFSYDLAPPSPTPTGSRTFTLSHISRFAFATPSPSSDIGDLAANTFLATGHSGKNGAGYVIASRGVDPAVAPFLAPGQSTFVQKFTFASSTSSSFITDPSLGSPGYTTIHDYHIGWTNGEEAIIAGKYPLGTEPLFSEYTHMDVFKMASEVMVEEGGVNMYMQGGPSSYRPSTPAGASFPFGTQYGGASVASTTHGYWVGIGDSFPSPYNVSQNHIRSFPFAVTTRVETGAADLAFGTTMTDHGEGHLIASNPFHGSTGYSSIDNGFVSTQNQASTPLTPYSPVQTGLEKFPFANVTVVSDIFEIVSGISPFSSGNKFRSSMGVGGIVS